ncbi:MAG TPA: Rne/Rng family ribonuclease [Gaiellaceae bacterium]|nr:Rne/Rng family ribonuclease [Gaiellaceae bacterium]
MARRWFRFGKKQDEVGMEAAPEAVAAEVEAPPEPEVSEPADEQSSAAGPKKRRRRGSRGGKGRKKPGAAAPSADGEPDPPQDAGVAVAERTARTRSRQAPKADGKPERKQSRAAARRRTPTKRAPLPAAKRELVISVDVGEQRVAILEDDRVAEVYLERPERRSIAGNIYLGVVDNVLPGMEAAFVEIGLEKNGFLYVDEIVGPELEGRKGARKIQDLIKRGQTVMVQAVKDPMKSKGARLTTEISLPGRFLVYVPNGEGSGVSRRLEDAERTRLKEIVKRLDPKGGGIIVRTAAEGASAEDIERDLVFLQRLWKTIQTKSKGAKAPSLVYEEAELPLRIVRDLFAGDFIGARIDDDRTHRRIVSYLKKTSPHMVERVHRYREKEPLFEASGVDAEIRSTLQRRVDLPSGGYLVFDYAEAFTVIDVNTGRFVGSRGKSAQGRLEDTIVKNNLEAVKEVVRQLRLRDIGGIIVIDFIDMSNPKNRETVEEALRSELERDRTKTYVVEISPLGLVEMTRQNVTDGPREILTNRCPACAGDGVVVSDATHALEVERQLRAIAKGSRVQAFKVAVHPRVLSLLAAQGGSRLTALEAAARRRFFLVPATGNGHVHLDHFEVLAQGKLDALRPDAPVAAGDSVEIKLVEVGLHDPGAGVGKLDAGYEVVVAGAAKLVGKKVTARVGAVLEGTAFATLADDSAPTADPITFEAEAEKPTRASRAKKEPTAAAPELDEIAETAEAEAEPADEELAEVDDSEPTEADDLEPTADADGAPKKKRTRRGTRGGRGRKKPAVAGAAAKDNGEESSPGEENGRPAPRIHVPPADFAAPVETTEAEPVEASEPEADSTQAVADGVDAAEGVEAADGPPKRKRARRGSRGGRKRKKPSVNGDEQTATEPEAEPEPEPERGEVVAVEDAPEYVPMSEWIDDFDARKRG